MKSTIVITCLLTALAVALLPSCLMRQTVTQNGQVLSSDYVVKRPLKDAIENSENAP